MAGSASSRSSFKWDFMIRCSVMNIHKRGMVNKKEIHIQYTRADTMGTSYKCGDGKGQRRTLFSLTISAVKRTTRCAHTLHIPGL